MGGLEFISEAYINMLTCLHALLTKKSQHFECFTVVLYDKQ